MSVAGSEERETSDAVFTAGVAVAGAALIVVLSFLRFGAVPALPAKPPPPTIDKNAVQRMDKESAFVYKANLEQDADTYGVAKITPEEMAKPFPYEKSDIARKLVPGKSVEVGVLTLTMRIGKLERRSRSGAMTSEHIILKIENTSDHAVAYRVKTSLGADSACTAKAPMEQNAIALAAHSSLERSECLSGSGRQLAVLSVEAMQIPPLSYFYLSHLEPQHIGLDGRTTQGHVSPKGAICTTIPQQLIQIGMDKGTVEWRDVVDFYARHRCETYDFPVGYRAIAEGQTLRLPVTGPTK
jgi:hypothetical protein